jgi:hypothetical protein
MPALVVQGMNHRKITACLVLSRNMVASPPPQSFGQMDEPSHAQPCTWHASTVRPTTPRPPQKAELPALVTPAFQVENPLKPFADAR